MSLKLYIDWVSQPCRAVVVLCKALHIPHEIVEVRLFKGQHFAPDFNKISATRKLPAMAD